MMTMESRAGKRRERSIPYFPSHRPLRKAPRTFPANLLKKSREDWGRSYLERGRESNFFIARGRGWEDIWGDHIVFNGRRRGNICP